MTATGTAAVAQAANVIASITAVPEQLSANAADNALELVTSLTAGLSTRGVEFEGAIGSLADVMSNLVQASTSQSVDSTSQDQFHNDSAAMKRSVAVGSVVESLSSSLAGDMVPGEEEKTIATHSFAMMVQSEHPDAFAGKTIGGGRVVCPSSGLPSPSGQPASAKVVAWAGDGPLSWAAEQSVAGDNSTLASPIISVSFVDSSDGSTIN